MDLLSTPARVFTAVLCLVSLLVAYFGTVELCRSLRLDGCPADSFLSRISLQAFVVMALPLAVALGGTLALAMDAAAGGSYLGASRVLVGVSGIAGILIYPVVLWAGLGNELCLSPGAIAVRTSRLAPVQDYAWQDVQALAVSCYEGGPPRRTSRIGATLWMKDGRKIEIKAYEYLRIHGRLGAALAGTGYHFGPPFIDATCPAAYRSVFSAPP